MYAFSNALQDKGDDITQQYTFINIFELFIRRKRERERKRSVINVLSDTIFLISILFIVTFINIHIYSCVNCAK